MAVIVEFSLESDAFPFGRATSAPEVRVQLERVIPLKEDRIPFVWASGEDLDQFESSLSASDVIREFEPLTRVGDSVLYYTEWWTEEETFLNGLAETGGSIMEAHGGAEWSFTVRFRDHTDLTRFHHFYQDREFPVRIERVSPLDERTGTEYGFGLTPEQRETLIMAVENGYFSIPRETTLDELAEELNLSSQAVSERIRRATETVLRKALVGLVADPAEPATDE